MIDYHGWLDAGDRRLEDFDYQNMKRDEFIMERMEQKRDEVLTLLLDVVHPRYLESFARLLDYCQNEHEPEALKIVKELHLKEEDFFALRGDFENFSEWYGYCEDCDVG